MCPWMSVNLDMGVRMFDMLQSSMKNKALYACSQGAEAAGARGAGAEDAPPGAGQCQPAQPRGQPGC